MKQLFLKYKKSLQNVGIYFIASLIPMVLSMAINPLIALNMEPRDYAIVGYFNSFNGLISPLVVFYSFHYYTKRFFELDEDGRIELRSTIVQALVYFSLLLAALSALGIFIYMKYLNKGTDIAFFPYALLSVFALPLTGIYTLMLTDYKMQKRAKDFFRFSILKSIVSISLILLLVVLLKQGALGRLGATFLVNLFLFVWCLVLNWKCFRKKIDWSIFKAMIRFTWPLTLAAMLGFFSNGYDKVFLERLGDVKELGYYVVGLSIAGYIRVFQTAIGNTFQPDIYENIVKRNWKGVLKFASLIIGLTTIVVLGFIIVAPFVVDLLTAGKYTYSVKYTRIVAIAQISSSLYYVLSQITVALGATKITLVNKIVGSILCVVMFSYLITKWQFIGAAWGQVFSFVIFFVGNLFLLGLWKSKRIKGLLTS